MQRHRLRAFIEGARLARSVDAHLVCAYVDPAGYLAEWDPPRSNTRRRWTRQAVSRLWSLPRKCKRASCSAWELQGLGGPSGLLSGAAAPALARLTASTGVSLLIVGGPRPGVLAKPSACWKEPFRIQDRPVLVLPAG